MPDDPTKQRPHDASRINIDEYWELEYWSKKFGVTKEKITEAVKAVGTSANEVGEYLHKQ